jgi:hypothetical protein
MQQSFISEHEVIDLLYLHREFTNLVKTEAQILSRISLNPLTMQFTLFGNKPAEEFPWISQAMVNGPRRWGAFRGRYGIGKIKLDDHPGL